MKTKINAIVAITIMTFIALGCNASFSTAKIDSFNFGKNETATPTMTTFNVGEKIFAVAIVTNSISKCKVKFKYTLEPTAGGKPQDGSLDVDLPGSGSAQLSLTPTMPGTFKVDASLVDESGKELDKKSGSVTIKGDAPAPKDTKKDDTKKDDESHSEDNTKEH